VRERFRTVWERLTPPEIQARLEPLLPLVERAVRAAGQYRRRLLGDVGGFVFVSVIVMALYAGVLYGLELWWTVFRETAVGERFVHFFTERASTIETFLAQPLWLVTGKVYLTAAAAGLLVGAIGQFFLLKRYLYDFASCPIRLAVWGGATVAVAALWAAEAFALDPRNALLITAAPALAMFAACIALAARLCPQITTVGRVIFAGGGMLWRLALRWWEHR
jgi:hypothetical protein